MTIHNIGESKFHQSQSEAHLTNGVEITRVTCPPQTSGCFPVNQNLAVGSHRHQQTKGSDASNGSSAELGGKFYFELSLN